MRFPVAAATGLYTDLLKVVINAVSAKLGGAATYARNLARSLAEQGGAGDEFVFVTPRSMNGAAAGQPAPGVRMIFSDGAEGSYAARWWWDQVGLRRLLQEERPDVLFSSANFGMARCPCPQVLLVRNPIYFSREYLETILPEKGLRLRAETSMRRWLVCRSVAAADRVMTPSAAMMDDLAAYVRVEAARRVVNPYGVPRARVNGGSDRAEADGGPLRLLWVSHYADHKNLATLLRAAALLREARVPFELQLTLDPAGTGQHTAMPAAEGDLLRALGDSVRAVGVQSYEGAWQLYAKADVFVFPSLVESFGHPLVEAMAAGLPIVASDVRIHREICGDAAAYFPALDAEGLAATLRWLAGDAGARRALALRGSERVKHFLWEDHVARLLDVLRQTAAAP